MNPKIKITIVVLMFSLSYFSTSSTFSAELSGAANRSSIPSKVYQDTIIGIRFVYPEDWDLKVDCSQRKRCQIALWAKNIPSFSIQGKNFSDFPIQITISNDSFEVLKRRYFNRHGQENMNSFYDIKGANWSGVMEQAIYFKTGDEYSSEAYTAIIDGGNRRVVIYSDDQLGVHGIDAASRIHKSFEFIE